jgi:hypothetical protein
VTEQASADQEDGIVTVERYHLLHVIKVHSASRRREGRKQAAHFTATAIRNGRTLLPTEREATAKFREDHGVSRHVGQVEAVPADFLIGFLHGFCTPGNALLKRRETLIGQTMVIFDNIADLSCDFYQTPMTLPVVA